MRAGSVLLGSALLTIGAFGVVDGRAQAPLLAVAILVVMGCLVALTTGVHAGSRGR